MILTLNLIFLSNILLVLSELRFRIDQSDAQSEIWPIRCWRNSTIWAQYDNWPIWFWENRSWSELTNQLLENSTMSYLTNQILDTNLWGMVESLNIGLGLVEVKSFQWKIVTTYLQLHRGILVVHVCIAGTCQIVKRCRLLTTCRCLNWWCVSLCGDKSVSYSVSTLFAESTVYLYIVCRTVLVVIIDVLELPRLIFIEYVPWPILLLKTQNNIDLRLEFHSKIISIFV